MTKVAKLPKRKSCKVCKEKFQPKQNFQTFCTPECGWKLSQIKKEERERKQHKIDLKRVRKPSQAGTKRLVHDYVKLRDRYRPCMSCGRRDSGQWDAGHFMPSTNSRLKFDPQNIHKECAHCNQFSGNHLVSYRVNLIAKIGLEEVERLENTKGTKTWTWDELAEIRKDMRERIKQLKNV